MFDTTMARRHAAALVLLVVAGVTEASTSGVVISQVYGGNGNTYQRDYVELFNAGSAAVDVTGWSVQYASATGSGHFAGNGVTVLGGMLQPGRYHLIALGPTSAGGAVLPAPDTAGSSSTNLSSASGKVVLSNQSAGLACNGASTPCSAAQLAQIVDLVGYGSANFFEGGAAAPGLTTTSALLRAGAGCADTDSNGSDFAGGTPAPRNGATAPATCGGPPPATARIYEIQGSGETSPLVGQSVTTEGVVTAVFPGLRGYYLQDESGDGNPATSDGVFVFANSTSLPVVVGDRVRITATVAEFSSHAAHPTVTELVAPGNLVHLGTGAIVPTPITLPEASDGELERHEGMLVQITSTLTASQNFFQGRYGQVTLSAGGRLLKPTHLHRPGTGAAMLAAQDNARRRIVLDDGQSAESFFSGVENPNPIPYIGDDNTLRAGDTVSDLTGVIDFGRITSATGASAIVDYKLHPTAAPSFVRSNARNGTPPAVGGSLKVASFNVLNYFTTFGDGSTASGGSGQGCLPSNTTADCRGADSLPEFERQRAKTLAALLALDADVVGLIELQRNGYVAVQNLVDALNGVLGGGTYAVVPEPASGVGSDAIKLGFIYKPARVSLVGAGLSDTSAVHNRPPVAQTFQSVDNGQRFSVIVNHFKSKGCDGASGLDLDQGDGQGCFNDRRRQQANALLAFVTGVQQTAGDNDVLVIGDLNAYAKEDPVDILVAGGLADLLLRFAGSENYSYVFDGESGSLDHALATPSLAMQIAGAADWHINADEPSVIDYNLEFKPQDLYTPTPYRSSDHDPLVLGLQLGGPRPQTIQFDPLPDQVYGNAAFTVIAHATSGLPVSLSSLTAPVCSVLGDGVTLLAAGTCSIAADQPGDGGWAPAAQVVRSFVVAKATQTIAFGALPPRTLGEAPFGVFASASSGLVVLFSSTTPAVCSVTPEGTVTLLAVGTCGVAADQPGDANHEPAGVVQSFAVGAGDADVPLPWWAIALGAALVGRVATRRRA